MVQISTDELVRALCSFYTQILTPGGQRERSEIIFFKFRGSVCDYLFYFCITNKVN